jgi:dissimilatory sulfite reductase (desulfoviridin) alpha/beta subunit
VRVWAGGRIGRDPKLGEVVIAFLPPAKIPLAIEASLVFFREYGKSKERFGKVIERIGWEKFREVMERATKQDA